MTPRLTVATSFPVFPPRGGGQARIAGLYGALARLGVEVEIVSLVPRGERAGSRPAAPGVTETRVPMSAEHDWAEHDLRVQAAMPATDIGLALHHELTPAFGDAIARSAARGGPVVASHPFAEPAIVAATAAPLVYEAHNVEADLKAEMLAAAGSEDGEVLAGVVRDVEAACCERAELILVAGQDDAARLSELYGADPARMCAAPNGADPDAVEHAGPALRAQRKAAVGMAGTPVAMFVGSWHEPNLDAVRSILAAAHALPAVRFLVLGSAGDAFAGEDALPPNADMLGLVPEGMLRSVLGFADVALNPMRYGSGTNLKMVTYALAGVPIISSTTGARGLGFEPGRHYADAGPEQLAAALSGLLAEQPDAVARRSLAARDACVASFSWDVIAAGVLADERARNLLEGVPA